MNQMHYGRKRSGIRRELSGKIEEWLLTIDDAALRQSASNDVIVTGGAIASMLLGEPVNDFDAYFRTKKTTLKVAKYYVDKFNASKKLQVGVGVTEYAPEVREETINNIKGAEEDRVLIFLKSAGVASETQAQYSYFESLGRDEAAKFADSIVKDIEDGGEKYRPIFMSQNAITLSNKMQLVTRFYGEPKEIHDNYDFVHAMCFWDHAKGELNLPADALEAMLSRTLVYHGSLYPVATIFRAKKFIERGWRISAGQLLKIMWQISEIDLKDYSILREQLTGVDAGYMGQLIEALKGVDQDKINSTYIATIIDRIFDQ